MFPSQMMPINVLTLLNFHGWKKAIVLTEEHTQLEVCRAIKSFIIYNKVQVYIIVFIIERWIYVIILGKLAILYVSMTV